MTSKINKKEKEILLEFAKRLALESADIIRPFYGDQNLAIELKEDDSPVTQADKQAEGCMRALIEKHYPDHGIIGEEYGEDRPNADWVWVLDPVDGTKSFIHNVPLFGSIIGLTYQGRPEVGCLHVPMLDILCLGDNDHATRNGSVIKMSGCHSLSDALLLTSDVTLPGQYHSQKGWDSLVSEVKLLRTWGDCFGYVQAASGWAQIMVDPVAAPWDYMGAIPVIQGAGGIVTDWNGDDPIGKDSIVATSKELHEQVIAKLNSL